MNRRGFISLMGALAAAPLVPWRGLIEPLISLPLRPNRPNRYNEIWVTSVDLTEASLEEMLRQVSKSLQVVSVRPTQLIVRPEVRHLIDTDPYVRLAARLAGANV